MRSRATRDQCFVSASPSYRVRAEVVQIHGFSGHADQADLLKLLAPLARQTQRVFLVHGELDQSEVLVEKLRAAKFPHVEAAQRGQRVEL